MDFLLPAEVYIILMINWPLAWRSTKAREKKLLPMATISDTIVETLFSAFLLNVYSNVLQV